MSTTIKRVALVAVAALGLGVLSVAPSQAVSQADTLAISATTAAIQTGETATVTLTGTFLSGATAAGDTLTVTSSATALPAGASVMPSLVASDTVNATIGINTLSATIQSVAANTATSGKITVNVVVPAGGKAGTYSYKFTPSVPAGSTLNSSAVTLVVTVTAAPADDTTASAAKTTSILQTGETVTSGSAADSATVISKAVVADAQAATVLVTVKNAAGTTLATQPALTVIVKAGTPGLVGAANVGATTSMTASGRALTTTAGQLIGIFADGTEGVGVVEIYAGTVLLATESVTFFGAVASYAATNSKKVVGVGETSTITVTGADKAGNKTAAPSVYAVSSDSSVATVSAAASSTITLTGVKSGKTTIKLYDTAAGTAATITGSIDVVVGAVTAKTVTISFSNSAPTAGEKVTVTLTALDASGNAVGDGVRSLMSSTGFASSVTVQGSTLPTVDTVTLSAGVAEYVFYAPSAGTVTFTATEGTATDSTTKGSITGSITVSNPGLDAATDAANDALDAANAATDAANTAAEAADAATTAAQEASDAVAALSESVTKLIAGLQAQIKSLAAVVAKIAKKVKA